MKITLLEQQCIDSIKSKDRSNLHQTLKLTEKIVNSYKTKNTTLLKESIKKVKGSILTGDFETAAINVYGLKEEAMSLMKEAVEQKTRINDKDKIKNIRIETVGEDKGDLETIYVTFEIPYTVKGERVSDITREMKEVKRINKQLGDKIVRRLLPKLKDYFTGTGIFTEPVVRTNILKQGNVVNSKNEIAIDTKGDEDFDYYVKGINILMTMLNDKIEEYFNATLEGAKYLDKYKEEEKEKEKEDSEGEVEEDEESEEKDKEYYNSEKAFETPDENEIDKLAYSKAKKGKNLSEESVKLSREKDLTIQLLTEKIERISGKKVKFLKEGKEPSYEVKKVMNRYSETKEEDLKYVFMSINSDVDGIFGDVKKEMRETIKGIVKSAKQQDVYEEGDEPKLINFYIDFLVQELKNLKV